MLKKIAALAVAGALSIGVAHATGPGEAIGFPDGWTTLAPSSCVTTAANRLIIYVSATGDKRLLTSNPVWATQLSPFCTNGQNFAAHVTKGVWDNIAYSVRLNR